MPERDLFGQEFSESRDATKQQKGGKARAEKLSPMQRTEIARLAAQSRWGSDGHTLKATHGGDRPLTIGDLRIPCYVLEDGCRVLSLGGMLEALNMSKGGTPGRGDRLASFVMSSRLFPFLSNDLIKMINEPIRFRAPSGGSVGTGYEAKVLPELCDAVLAARKAGKLLQRQEHIADRCEILVRGFARVGIIALIDEATGYQEIRDREALEEILNKYLQDELRKWTKTFPHEYFKQMFRLRGWSYPNVPVKKPSAVAHYTNDLIYSRLAPGILEELQRLNPSDGHGRRKHKHFQFFTGDYGDPRLREHITKVTTLMTAAGSWAEFYRLLQRALPRVNTNLELPLPENENAA